MAWFPLSKSALRKLSDEELFHQYHQHQQKELIGELFDRYLHLVLGVCFKYLKEEEKARDAAMAVFEKLMTGSSRQEVHSFKDWLFILTKNHCLMIIRHEQAGQRMLSEKFHELQAAVMENSGVMHLYDAEEQEHRFEKLRQALARLPDEQRQCIELFYYEDKSYQEVGQLTGFEIKKVKSCLQNGKRNLKIMLDHGTQ